MNIVRLNRGSKIVITLLVLIITFLGGIKYGQAVLKVNYNVGELERLLPTYFPTPSPAKTPKIDQFSLHAKEACKISVPISGNWEVSRETSNSAVLKQRDTLLFAYDCLEDVSPFTKKKMSTGEAVLEGKSHKTQTFKEDGQMYHVFSTPQASTSAQIQLHLIVNEHILPYVESALKRE